MSWLPYLIWRSRPPWFHFPIIVGDKQSSNVWRKKLSSEKASNFKHKQINAWSFWAGKNSYGTPSFYRNKEKTIGALAFCMNISDCQDPENNQRCLSGFFLLLMKVRLKTQIGRVGKAIVKYFEFVKQA